MALVETKEAILVSVLDHGDGEWKSDNLVCTYYKKEAGMKFLRSRFHNYLYVTPTNQKYGS